MMRVCSYGTRPGRPCFFVLTLSLESFLQRLYIVVHCPSFSPKFLKTALLQRFGHDPINPGWLLCRWAILNFAAHRLFHRLIFITFVSLLLHCCCFLCIYFAPSSASFDITTLDIRHENLQFKFVGYESIWKWWLGNPKIGFTSI